MNKLQELKPEKVFYYFEELSKIPHISFHEQAISDYCANFAKERNLAYRQDEMGNIIIFANATAGYEKADTIMIQGHLDMVGEKNADCTLDMEKEGVELIVDNDFVYANGSTLGGDNGIAIAYALALLDSNDIPHPDLEIVLTVSEEVGLLGATAIDLSECKATKMLNIDSEVEGILTVGCAGGMRHHCYIPVDYTNITGNICSITINGLMGGHSGIEINKGRANANVLMGRLLFMINEKLDFGLIDIRGGSKENVIPNQSSARIVIEDADLLSPIINNFLNQMKAEYGTADPDITVNINNEGLGSILALDSDSLNRVLTAINLMPNGVQNMSIDLPGLVETSLNIGIMELIDNDFILKVSIRSSISSAKTALSNKIKLLTKTLNGTIDCLGDYPAWPYKKDSKLKDLCIDVYAKQYGTNPAVETLHAGLECGIFSDKMPNMDCISFGPNLYNVHTPNEKMSISSVERVWEYLKAILAAN